MGNIYDDMPESDNNEESSKKTALLENYGEN